MAGAENYNKRTAFKLSVSDCRYNPRKIFYKLRRRTCARSNTSIEACGEQASMLGGACEGDD